MAKITQQPDVKLEVVFTVSEPEARALEALAGYGDDAFLKVFYEHLGRHYMEPHEAGMREFLKSVRGLMSPILHRADDARAVFNQSKVAVRR